MAAVEAKRVKSHASTTASQISSISQKGEYGYPLGHLGHLTDAQKEALEKFRALVAEQGLYTPAEEARGEGGEKKPASHDDVTLLRYLRARRFVPQDAVGQFKDTEKWRGVNEIDNLYMNIDFNEYEETRKLYPQWTGRRDKRGLPVYVFEVAPLNSKTMSAYAKSATSTTVLNQKNEKKDVPPRLYRLFALYENLTNFIMPLCTSLRDRPSPETPISQANNIVDISGVGLKQFWNLRSHMQDASVLATAHYPETLDRIFIVGAPVFFPTVWEWIKRWFDPITTSKIFILSSSTAFKTLSTFIDPENIPEKYGGKLPFKFGDTPILDDKIASQLTWKDDKPNWPKGPMKWVENEADGDGDGVKTWNFVAVGSENKAERRTVLATFRPDPVPEPLEEAVLKLHIEETANANGNAVAVADAAIPVAVAADADKAPAKEAKDDGKDAKGVEPVPLAATAEPLPKQTGAEKKSLEVAAAS